MKRRFEVTMTLEYELDEWADNGDKEINYTNHTGVAMEIDSWLSDLGFEVTALKVLEV